LGSRVIVNSNSGSKTGILRYLGTTEFAKGDWAGVELSEKLGKNDGSVGNKRYFQCEPMYGVFAPAQKVELYKETSATPIASKQSVIDTGKSKLQTLQSANMTRSTLSSSNKPCLLNKMGNKQLNGSQESLASEKSSIYSTASVARQQQIKSLQTKPSPLSKTIVV
jgi:CAP-Gly domain-containing linker protein 1